MEVTAHIGNSNCTGTANICFVHFNTQCLCSKRVNKLHDDFFIDLFGRNDILLFAETWTSELSDISVNNFETVPLHRVDKHRGSRRDSGGLICYIRSSLMSFVNVYAKDSDDIIILKVCKTLLGIDHDLYLFYSYILPENSSRTAYQESHTLDFYVLYM